jgi:predicted aspartyl protease
MTLISGFFRNDAGFINAHLVSEDMSIDETVEFLVDTGASRTTLLDKDAIYLGIEYEKLSRVQDLSGIGGSVETYVIDDTYLLFREYTTIKMPIFVIRHPLERMDEEERIKILRFPSILGRDVINRFKLIFDRAKSELLLTKEEKEVWAT